jgi:hypothetical protein
MLKMKGSAVDLSMLVNGVHNKFGSNSSDLVKILNDLQIIQREKENASSLLEMSAMCKEIAGLMLEVKREIENDNHYSAMRIIERIQTELLINPALLPMKRTLEAWAPMAVNKLLYAARTEADNFLNDLRTNKMGLIGNTVLLKQIKSLVRNDEVLASVRRSLTPYDDVTLPRSSSSSKMLNKDNVINNNFTNNNDFVIPLKYSITTKYIITHLSHLYTQSSPHTSSAALPVVSLFPLPISLEDLLSHHCEPNLYVSSDGINLLENSFVNDIASIHKSLHLYAILGNIQNYYDHYSHHRYDCFKMRLIKNVEKNISSNGLLKSVSIYCEELVGFFMIEILIYKLIENNSIHFSTKELDYLWEETIEEFTNICLHFAITLTSPNELIQIKEEIVVILFVILDNNIFYPHWNITVLLKSIKRLWEIFDALQVQLLQKNIFLFLSKASFQPLQITSYNSLYLQMKFYQIDFVEINDDTSSSLSNKYQCPPSVSSEQSVGEKSSKPQQRTSYHLSSSSSSSSNPAYLSVSLPRKELMSAHRVEASLDALEKELSEPSSTINIHSNDNALFSSKHDGRSTNSVGNSGKNFSNQSSSFLPQTYPFSEFIPLIMKELHSMLLRLFAYGIIPIPERHNKHFMSEMYKLQSIQSVKFDSVSVDDPYGNSGRQKISSSLNPSQSSLPEGIASIKQSIHSSSSLFHNLQEMRLYETICCSVKLYFQVIINTLSQELLKDGLETILSKAVQIFLDSSALSVTTDYFFYHLFVDSLVIIFGKENIDFSFLTMIYQDILAMIRLLMSKSQDMIFELLSNKIEVLLESSLLFINLAPETFSINLSYLSNNPNSSQVNINNLIHSININNYNAFLVHENVESIIEFLKITFMCLTHLPKTIRETVYYVSCYKLANGLIAFLLSNKVPHLNIFGILSIDADCKRMVQFAESCGIIHLKECFDELSQMIAALLSPDLFSFGDNVYVRSSLFPRVNVMKLIILLEKVSFSFCEFFFL